MDAATGEKEQKNDTGTFVIVEDKPKEIEAKVDGVNIASLPFVEDSIAERLERVASNVVSNEDSKVAVSPPENESNKVQGQLRLQETESAPFVPLQQVEYKKEPPKEIKPIEIPKMIVPPSEPPHYQPPVQKDSAPHTMLSTSETISIKPKEIAPLPHMIEPAFITPSQTPHDLTVPEGNVIEMTNHIKETSKSLVFPLFKFSFLLNVLCFTLSLGSPILLDFLVSKQIFVTKGDGSYVYGQVTIPSTFSTDSYYMSVEVALLCSTLLLIAVMIDIVASRTALWWKFLVLVISIAVIAGGVYYLKLQGTDVLSISHKIIMMIFPVPHF